MEDQEDLCSGESPQLAAAEIRRYEGEGGRWVVVARI